MNILQDPLFAVQAAVINDGLYHEGGRLLFCDERGAGADVHGVYKCVFRSAKDYVERAGEASGCKYVCAMGLPIEEGRALFAGALPYVSFAYLAAMPPEFVQPAGGEIKRLAPSLAGVVSQMYRPREGGYTAEEAEEVMREKGVFGAIVGGALAGIIGRHGDGAMGMLEIGEKFRRRGLGGALEGFLINYIMTFGRTPHCDVAFDNVASLALQQKLGLSRGPGYCFWADKNQ